MHHKNIKKIIRENLKKYYPKWNKLKYKEKKNIAQKVLHEVLADYDFKSNIDADKNELLGIEDQVYDKNIINLDEMKDFISQNKSNSLLKLTDYKHQKPNLTCPELSFIDKMLDNQVIDSILAYKGYSPQMRNILPHQLLRTELLKTLKYPEISYRKYCTKEYLGMHQKENKSFICLQLHKNTIIDHTVLSKFRNSLCFYQLVNLVVYVLYQFKLSGFITEGILHGIDSTELAGSNQKLLASFEIKGKRIRIYNDLDCDCGKRRNKKDKSTYVVGYRMHTLTAIHPDTGLSYPLISLLAPANHHDSHFAHPLISLAQAIGLNVRLVTADEAYHDKDNDIYDDLGATIITPPDKKTLLPDFVDVERKHVFCHEHCSVPMQYLGVFEHEHEYKCTANWGECPFAQSCPQTRSIPLDAGYFQRINLFIDQAQQPIDIRKNAERPYNLLKNREGLKTPRPRSKHGILVQCTFAQMVTLLLEMAGTRRKHKPEPQKERQLPLPIAA